MSDETGIRAARRDECELVAQIHERAATVAYAHIFPDQPFPREDALERWREFSGEVLVAEEDNLVIGFAAFDASELHALYVLPEHQGKGIGSRLLDAAGSAARLWVLKENADARRFYESRGWCAEGTEQVSHGVVELLYCRGSNGYSPPFSVI
jgi:ribosomal protein S18 acetylase RimI-like enzyme